MHLWISWRQGHKVLMQIKNISKQRKSNSDHHLQALDKVTNCSNKSRTSLSKEKQLRQYLQILADKLETRVHKAFKQIKNGGSVGIVHSVWHCMHPWFHQWPPSQCLWLHINHTATWYLRIKSSVLSHMSCVNNPWNQRKKNHKCKILHWSSYRK